MADRADNLAEAFFTPSWRDAIEECRQDPALAEQVSLKVSNRLFERAPRNRVPAQRTEMDIQGPVIALAEVTNDPAHTLAHTLFHVATRPSAHYVLPEKLDPSTLRWMIEEMPARTRSLIADEGSAEDGSPEQLLQKAIWKYRALEEEVARRKASRKRPDSDPPLCPGALQTTFQYDYGQIYLYDAESEWSQGYPPGEEALVKAQETRLTAASSDGLVVLILPRRDNSYAHLEVSTADSSPPLDSRWDHIVEFDLDVPSGCLALESPTLDIVCQVDTPRAHFRARWHGACLAEAAAWDSLDDPPDHYLLLLWPRHADGDIQELKRFELFDAPGMS